MSEIRCTICKDPLRLTTFASGLPKTPPLDPSKAICSRCRSKRGGATRVASVERKRLNEALGGKR